MRYYLVLSKVPCSECIGPLAKVVRIVDEEGYSPATANKFKQMLGLPTVDAPPEVQGTLF
jgi:hypothetical protein